MCIRDSYNTKAEKEIVKPLFEIDNSKNALRFKCTKKDEVIQMDVPFSYPTRLGIFSKELDQYIERTWSNKNFVLNLFRPEAGEATVEVREINRNASYVLDNERNVVWLSSALQQSERKRILAHEFGHVLGFPDCYIQFFEKTTQNYVYYEFNESPNIMCSPRSDVVPENYFKEITEKLCSF